MSAVAEVSTVNISINDNEIAVPKGELIVESVKRLGLEVPIFCYHPRMKPVGMCRMCLVEVGFKQPDGSVRKMPKPQTACSLPATDGMVIYTDTELVHTDRRGVLEFLLINHPLDCPICDRGGECPLQNNTLFYGPSTSRFVELKRHLPKAFPLSQYVTLDLERCIQCGRCVRFTEEISGDSQLAFRFRGAEMQPSTFELKEFESKFSGNVIEICPVGALTSSKYRFRARPWDLETKPGICTLCSNGCNIHIDYRVGKIVRVNGRTNEAINEEWTCDRGKFGHDFYNSESRLGRPLYRQGDSLVPTDWSRAYNEVLRAFTSNKGAGCAGLISAGMSNEDLFEFGQLFSEAFGSSQIAYRWQPDSLPSPSKPFRIAELEQTKSILVFGTSLAEEEPIVFLRVRKAWYLNQAVVVVAYSEDTEVDSFAHTILRYRPGTEAQLAAGLRDLQAGTGDAARVEAETGVPARRLAEAVEALGSRPTVLVTTAIQESSASALLGCGDLQVLARAANEEGARRLGLGQVGVEAILRGCAEGRIKALWLAGVDPFEAYPDRDLVRRALEAVDFLVVQGVLETEATGYASVVLPMTAPAESEGTFTNVEGRVQRLAGVLSPVAESKPAWRTYSEVGLRVKPQTPQFSASEVGLEIAERVAAFRGLDPTRLGQEGYLLPAI